MNGNKNEKFFLILFSIAMILNFTACTNNDTADKPKDNTATQLITTSPINTEATPPQSSIATEDFETTIP